LIPNKKFRTDVYNLQVVVVQITHQFWRQANMVITAEEHRKTISLSSSNQNGLQWFYTSRGHGCGIYIELIIVDSKAQKQTHSRLRNCFCNAVYRQKSADKNPHP